MSYDITKAVLLEGGISPERLNGLSAAECHH